MPLISIQQHIETWMCELQALRTQLALTPAQDADLREELQVSIETIEAERPKPAEAHAEVPSGAALQMTPTIEVGSHGYFITNTNAIIRETNAVADSLLNLEGRYLRGQPMLVFVATEQRRPWLRKLVSFKHHPLSHDAEWHLNIQPVNGCPFPAVINVGKVLDRNGNLARLRWLVRPLRYNVR